MALTKDQMALIICHSQDECLYRSGSCGDCHIPASIIYAAERGLPQDQDYIDELPLALRLVLTVPASAQGK